MERKIRISGTSDEKKGDNRKINSIIVYKEMKLKDLECP